MPGQGQASRRRPEAGSRPRSWEATLWGRHIRCHELDQHLYLDGRYLDLTPTEFGLFWLLLRQALQANTDLARHHPAHQELAWDERISATIPERYLLRLGIVPTLDLVQAMSADLYSLISHWPAAASGARFDEDKVEEPSHFPSDSGSPGQVRGSSGKQINRSRASLSSHLDRLRCKLRCHGMDIGTVLLYGRSARGYLLCPLGDEVDPGGDGQ